MLYSLPETDSKEQQTVAEAELLLWPETFIEKSSTSFPATWKRRLAPGLLLGWARVDAPPLVFSPGHVVGAITPPC